MDGGHFTKKDIEGFNCPENKIEETLAKMNVLYGENHNIDAESAYNKAFNQVSQCEEKKMSGGKKSGSNYITVSTNISKALVKDFKLAYKPAIMQKCLSVFRKHSKAKDATEQLKDAEKYIREHKDEFVKMYEKEIKDAENKKKKSKK